MRAQELVEILNSHVAWLSGESTGQRADLRDADLRDADLRDANLRDANLRDADLRDADLRNADLRNANLQGANLRHADLEGADLEGANLRDADLRHADLRDADLQGVKLPDYNILPEGAFRAYKRVRNDIILELEVRREHAVCSLVGRKCRASEALVLSASKPCELRSIHDNKYTYHVGEVARASLDPDIRIECTTGIHFFLTREEAEAYRV